MNSEIKKIYCVISNYNTYQWIGKCLESLNNSLYPIHTIVVDDQSPDDSTKKIKRDYPEVELIELEQNRGFSVANNTGIKRAIEENTDYIFLLNMDAWIEPNTLKILVNIAESNPEYGILSPMHLNGSNTGFDNLFIKCIDSKNCPALFSDIYLKQTKDIYPVEGVNAAAWLVRSDVFKSVGLFDEIFVQYGQDDNFGHRVKYYGYKIGVTPKARIYHDREQRTKKLFDVRTDTKKQHKRLKVISMNPNETILEKELLLIRKQMSDFLINLQSGKIILAIQNIAVLLYGLFYPIRYRKRHEQLKKEMIDF